jgi:RNA polymerase sigma-70 factor, ECF subfamily
VRPDRLAAEAPAAVALSDESVVDRVRGGELALFELLMRRNNRRVYRAVRALVRDEAEVEDVMQQTYLLAYQRLEQFEGASAFSTWLVRIAIHEALGRLRRARRFAVLRGGAQAEEDRTMTTPSNDPSPEESAAAREIAGLLERAIGELPDIYRLVFMLREIEDMPTADVAQALDVSEDVVKTRLHRAKALLQARLAETAATHLGFAFDFHAPRCNRVVAGVMSTLLSPASPAS